MNEQNTLVYKNISHHFILERGPHFVVGLRDRWRNIYSERGLLLFPYLLAGARGCQRLCPLASRDASDRLRVPRSSPILCTQSKSDHVVFITWSPSGYTPVGPDCPDVLPCLLIAKWQLVKAHGVTRNEPKIYVIRYIIERKKKEWYIYT